MPLSPEALTLAPILLFVIVLWVTQALPLAVTTLSGPCSLARVSGECLKTAHLRPSI